MDKPLSITKQYNCTIMYRVMLLELCLKAKVVTTVSLKKYSKNILCNVNEHFLCDDVGGKFNQFWKIKLVINAYVDQKTP